MEPELENEIGIKGTPKTRTFDIGVVELEMQTTIHKSFSIPFDGYVFLTIPSWPEGAVNAIGFNLTAGGAVLIPTNKGVKYVTDSGVSYPIPTIQKASKGSTVTAEIRNESTTEPLDLQIKVVVTNFNPQLIFGGIL